jgi:predicted transcriptional regulator
LTKSDITLGYIKASSYRTKIIKALEGKKLTPIEMSKETDIPLSHVSNTLAELLEKDLVVCLTPKLKKGRLYELTKTGKGLLKNI